MLFGVAVRREVSFEIAEQLPALVYRLRHAREVRAGARAEDALRCEATVARVERLRERREAAARECGAARRGETGGAYTSPIS